MEESVTIKLSTYKDLLFKESRYDTAVRDSNNAVRELTTAICKFIFNAVQHGKLHNTDQEYILNEAMTASGYTIEFPTNNEYNSKIYLGKGPKKIIINDLIKE